MSLCGSAAQLESNSAFVQLEPAKRARYKPSRFNARAMADDGSLLLYNSFSSHRCVIPAPHRAATAALLSKTGTEEPLSKLGKYLLSQGYLVPEDVDEDAEWDIHYGASQYRTNAFELMLLSSEDCNFRCIYCSQQFKRGSMLPWVRNALLKLSDNRLKDARSFDVAWFGGEPLLGYDAIEELAPKFQDMARQRGIMYHSGITTNAYLLTPERSRALIEWGVSDYQITLDGTALDHDAHRPLATGEPTFATILHNLKAMSHYDEPFAVALRINFDNLNVKKLEPLFSQLAEELHGDRRFKIRFRAVGKWGGANDDALDVCGVRESLENLVQITSQARSHGLTTEPRAWELESNGLNVCYAARPYHFIVGADGKIMKCSVVLDTMDENVVGHLTEDGSLQLSRPKVVKWVKPYYRDDKVCNKCFFVPVCQGASCPLSRFSDTRPCPPAKSSIQQTLKDVFAEERA